MTARPSSDPPPSPTLDGAGSNDVWGPVRALLRSSTPRVVLIRSADHRVGSALLSEVLADHPGSGVVVVVPSDPAVGVRFDRPRPPLEVSWRVLAVPTRGATIATTVSAMRLIRTLVRNPEEPPSGVDPLWLPSAILEAYSLLPEEATPIVAVNSWDDLLARYFDGNAARAPGTPTESDLERILLTLVETDWMVHLVLLTRSARPVLENGSDLIVDVTAASGEESPGARVRLLSGGRARPRPFF